MVISFEREVMFLFVRVVFGFGFMGRIFIMLDQVGLNGETLDISIVSFVDGE